MKERLKISDLFSPIRPDVPSENMEATFIDQWCSSLNTIFNKLNARGAIDSNLEPILKSAVEDWRNHPDHGAPHSYYVYEGMRWLAQQDEQMSYVSDEVLQALAVFHDLMQILPLINPQDGKTIEGNQRKLHAKSMSVAIRYLGRELSISPDSLKAIALAVRRHDDVYFGKYHKQMPYPAQLLSDSDKLFGAGLDRDPRELAIGGIERNLLSRGKTTDWYLLRDSDPEERLSWQYGDRWLSDRLSAVLKDMVGINFYTDSGKKIAQQRRKEFISVAPEKYALEYDREVIKLKKWFSRIGDPQLNAYLVGKGIETPEKQPDDDVVSLIRYAFNQPLSLPERLLRNQLVPRGVNIEISHGDDSFIIDPSIARFAFDETNVFKPEQGRENYKTAILSVITAYSGMK